MPQPRRITTSSSVVANYSDGKLQVTQQIDYEVEYARIGSVKLMIPRPLQDNQVRFRLQADPDAEPIPLEARPGIEVGTQQQADIQLDEDRLGSFRIIADFELSAPEILTIAEVSGLTIRDTIARLRDAGLDSIPGAGAEILDDEVRHRIARLKCNTAEWIDVHKTAHGLGLRTTATMMFGCGETYEHRVNHLETLRRLQEETGGFTAFIPWPFQPESTSLGRSVKEEVTAVEFLKTLALSRIYLDNFVNVQTSWVTQGLKVCQLGLRFGGNDVGSVMLEENVVRQAGASHQASEEDLRHMIRGAGFVPKQRDTLYQTYFLN